MNFNGLIAFRSEIKRWSIYFAPGFGWSPPYKDVLPSGTYFIEEKYFE